MRVADLLKVLYDFTEICIYEYGAFRGTFFFNKEQVDLEYFDRKIDQISVSCDQVNVIEIVLEKI